VNNLRGILLMVAAMAGFAVEDALIKAASATVPVGQILLLLGIGGTIVFGTLALGRRGRLIPRLRCGPCCSATAPRCWPR
jgi:drug/metabolite transporter (DMT)-like permease